MKLTAPKSVELLDLCPTSADFLGEVLWGLAQQPRRLPCKFFYDDRGARLFEQICQLPEYYVTRTEQRILREHASAMADFCGAHTRVVELGSGSCEKVRLLLDQLERPVVYIPVDISRRQLIEVSATLARAYPRLELLPVCADYAQISRLPAPSGGFARTVLFFPGSTLGNLEPSEASAFLEHLASWCVPGDRLLLGLDLEKPANVLLPAYNDAQGVTAAFNLNLLERANRELDANFVVAGFRHEAIYAREAQRIEMHLVCTFPHAVELGNERFTFRVGERIITEFSHKYSPRAVARLVEDTGWAIATRWTDANDWFGVFGLERR